MPGRARKVEKLWKKSAKAIGSSDSSAIKVSAYRVGPKRFLASSSSVIVTSCASFSKRASPRIRSAMAGTSAAVAGRMTITWRTSFGTIAQSKDKAHRAFGFGEARDLVVDKACRKPGRDDDSVHAGRAAALGPHDPDRAVRLDPFLDVLQTPQVCRVTRAHEHEIYWRARPSAHDVCGPLPEQRDEVLVVEVDDGDLRPRLHAELVQQRSGRRNVRAHPALHCRSLRAPPRRRSRRPATRRTRRRRPGR